MVRADYIHLAEVCMSVLSQFKPDESAADEVIRRFIWAIIASPNRIDPFDENDFRDMALGKKNFE